MISILIVLFTIALILDCLLLGLLILIQLPKKEAGVGVAFGAGATDALFGAGSGTALTKITKYTAFAFFGLVILLSIFNSMSHAPGSEFKRQLEKPAAAAPAPTTTTTTPVLPVNPAAGNAKPVIPLTVTTNTAPANAGTNPPAK